jgi:ATP-dependent Zn protease
LSRGLRGGTLFGVDGVTTGASNDIERATDLARSMVTKWGCPIDSLTYSEENGEVFLGRQMTQHKQVPTTRRMRLTRRSAASST